MRKRKREREREREKELESERAINNRCQLTILLLLIEPNKVLEMKEKYFFCEVKTQNAK